MPKTILAALLAGKTVTYTVRRLRGYLHGDISLVFKPADASIGEINIKHKLKCFRFDEKTYENSRWEVTPTNP
jgi:hypothetical protein